VYLIYVREYQKVIEENFTLKKQFKNCRKSSNNHRHKNYYEKNKETIKEKAKEYTQRMKSEHPEKVKEWGRNACLNQKAKKRQVR
jgi:hypothetical protein